MNKHVYEPSPGTAQCGAIVKYGNGEIGVCGLVRSDNAAHVRNDRQVHLDAPEAQANTDSEDIGSLIEARVANGAERSYGRPTQVIGAGLAIIVTVPVVAIVVGGLVWVAQAVWRAVL